MPLQRLSQRGLSALLVCCLIALAGACSPVAPALPEGAQRLGESELWVSAPQLRLVPNMAMGAAYFTVHNRGERGDRLIAVTGGAVEASLHETTLVDGVSRMRSRADGFPVAAGETLTLAPGGAHVMLSGALPEAEGAAATLSLTLRFEHAGEFTVEVPSPAFAVP